MKMFKKHKALNAEIKHLIQHYRNNVMDREISAHIGHEDFNNLMLISKSVFGRMTAIQAAFCLGYKEGQTVLKDKIYRHFLKDRNGGDSYDE